jgi:alkylated DNA repair dioxygenase AlkB
MSGQLDLGGAGLGAPEGFRYRPELLTVEQERELLTRIEPLPFTAFEFHGYVGKRRVVSFGWKYDFANRRVEEVQPIPEFLLPARRFAAEFAGLEPSALEQILVTEYRPGSAIGWHRDKAEFGQVIGLSLVGACPFRFRRRRGTKWDRYTQELAPRSVYLLTGPARTEWEHSIPAVTVLRYSITFRTLRHAPA